MLKENITTIRSWLDTHQGPKRIHMIAASKTRDEAAILAAKKNGVFHFGENYVQEAAMKQSAFAGTTRHLIGHLQRNKAKQAAQLFDVVHTVDTARLATALNTACDDLDKTIDIFIQVNIGEEPQKHGVFPESLTPLVEHIRTVCPQLTLIGLMCIPPANTPPTPYFERLKALAEHHNLPELSMGMSDSYKEAVRAGATYIRLGTALFGPRG